MIEQVIDQNDFIEEMNQIFLQSGLHERKLNFVCFDSDVFTYDKVINNKYFELSFIADDTLLKKMTYYDFINLNRLKYFTFKVYEYPNRKLIESYTVNFPK